ncbi:MAG: tripartite tricarboxylate transporter substrate binding protein [Pseudomonadota bacterium]
MTTRFAIRSVSGFAVSAFAFMAAAIALPAAAQQPAWPIHPVKIVVPQAPGGGTDALARILADRLQAAFGQTFIVENKTGAGGNIGTDYVAKQKPDGYTLLLTTNTHVTNVAFFAKLPYDPVADFTAVSLIASVPFVMSVNASSPYKTIKELIDAARAKPGTFTYSSGGMGTPHQLGVELFKSMTGTTMTHVPYKGSAPAALALLTNEVTVSLSAVNSMLPHIRSGKLRPLGVATAARTPLLPEVPTIAEAASLPNYELDIWYGVLVPAGTPRSIVDRLNVEINKIMRDPQVVKEKLVPQGLDSVGSTPERLAETIKSDLVKYRKIAKDANISPE